MMNKRIMIFILSLIFIVNVFGLFHFTKQREIVLYETSEKTSRILKNSGFNIINRTNARWNKGTISFYIESNDEFSASKIASFFSKDFYSSRKNEYTAYGSGEHYFKATIYISEPVSKDGAYIAELKYHIPFRDVIISVLLKIDYYIWLVLCMYVTIRIIVWLNERK